MKFFKETNFRETTIGYLPKDWDFSRVDDVLSLEYGKGLPKRKRKFGKYPVVGSNGIIDYHHQPFVNGPGIVVGRKGTVGQVTWIKADFCPIDTTYYVKLKMNKLSLKWMYYNLIHLDLTRFHLADVVPGLKRDLVYSLKTPLPSIQEQQKISDILSKFDKGIQKTDEIISKTERLKKGLMQELLTKGIGHKEFKETKIGRIPKNWNIVKLKTVCEVQGGGTPSTKNERYWNGKIPFATPTDITKIEEKNLNFLEHTERYITENGLKNSSTKLLPPGSVLLTSRATIGFCAINSVPVATNQGFTNIICKDKVFNVFALYLMRFLKRKLEQYAGGSTYKEISRTMVGNLSIPLPSFEEQNKIALILSKIDKQLEIERKEKEHLKKIKQGFMNLLLTGKVRVKVD